MKKLKLIQTKNDCFFEIDGERVGGVMINSCSFSWGNRLLNYPGERFPTAYEMGKIDPISIMIEPLNYEFRDELSSGIQEV